MNANELLIYLTRRQIKDTFNAARKLPADKLDWKPSPGSRSALDQLQEVATALDMVWSAYTDRKVTWSEEKFLQWKEERRKTADLDELEKMAMSDVERLAGFLETFDPSDFTAPVELPWPINYTLADCLAHTFWNGAYHEGQINAIAALLEDPS